MRLARAFFLSAFLACALSVAPTARASVSYAVVFDALLEESSAACVATPIEVKSVWESGRIATYTRVHVERVLSGTLASEVWIKTMGGAVGDIGQMVEGEAVLRPGQTSVLFVSMYAGSLVVTARGQGQFAIVKDSSGVLRLRKNMHAGALLAPNATTLARIRSISPSPAAASPAADVLDGKSIDEAAVAITSAWQRTHAAH